VTSSHIRFVEHTWQNKLPRNLRILLRINPIRFFKKKKSCGEFCSLDDHIYYS